MSAAHETREFIVERGMDAQAENARQARLISNPTPEIDSLTEIFAELARLDLSDRERLRLVARGIGITREIAAGNASERGHVRALTGAAELIGRKPLTVKEAARRLREPLGVLANPIIQGEKRARARGLVLEVLEAAPAGLLHADTGRPRAGIAGELNSVAKTTALADVIAEFLSSRRAAA